MRRHVELLDEIAESRLRAVAQRFGGVVVGEEHEDIWFCPQLLFFFGREPGARVCGAEEEEGCPRQHYYSNADGVHGPTFPLPSWCCELIVSFCSARQARTVIYATAPKPSKACSIPALRMRSLVANMLETRSTTLGLDFEDSLEGSQTKNRASGLTLVD